MEPTAPNERNYNTISPSAKMVLLMKGHTDIPYARQTAELVSHPETFDPVINQEDYMAMGRAIHFEERYKSIDQLLAGLPVKNILELSSGFSFRGLDAVMHTDVHYIDTDLPEMIATKKDIIQSLTNGEENNTKGKLELLPLNAVDEQGFKEVVSHFAEGEIAIVNEGLLMYLDTAEKEKLCGIIHAVLKERGGYWITADVYMRTSDELRKMVDSNLDKHTKEFFEQHRINENKFATYPEAEAFFNRMGFVIDKVADIDRPSLSAVRQVANPEVIRQMFGSSEVWDMRRTWRLRLKD